MMKQLQALTIWLLVSLSMAAGAAGPFELDFEEVAPGVWAAVRPDSPRFPVMGSATFVVSDEGVVVFDGGGVPVMAELLIEKIRSITDLPVTHVIISHWHGDHNFGIYRFDEEFENVQFVAHTFTDRAMNGSPIDYIANYPNFSERRLPRFKRIVETGLDDQGEPVSEHALKSYARIIADADVIDKEFKRVRLTTPNVVFDDRLVIHSGERRIELLNLGHGNTEGDIIMWLPDEKVVATGDLVVFPSPYAFNMPPKAWAQTLRKMNGLDYATLIPGHGAVQRDRVYVNLLIEVAEDIVKQRDRLISSGVEKDSIAEQLDFSAHEHRFTAGDDYLTGYYEGWFEQPFRNAAVKELSGEPMKTIEPRAGKSGQ
jgi:glyoxylase-like metal-dependent hydrolase (beta-lactamase superfamily II)